MKHISHKQDTGFTIVEVLVSLSIFTIVVTIAIGSLLVLIHANARTQTAQLIMTNLTFALDSMTREIRTGRSWVCKSGAGSPSIEDNSYPTTNIGDCVGGGTSISVVELSERLTSGLNHHRISYHYKVENGVGRIFRKLGGDTELVDRPWVALTSSEVNITEMSFVVEGTDSTDLEQPRATISIQGEIGNPSVPDRYKNFSIQTTINQNLIDVN